MSIESYWTEDPCEVLRVGPGFRLADAPTDAAPGFDGGKSDGQKALEEGAGTLADLQEQLYANGVAGGDERRVLLVLQAMDTAGKGGIVKHVMGSVDPQGVAAHGVQGADAPRSSSTTSSGASGEKCRRRARSASSTDRTTKTCSSAGCANSRRPTRSSSATAPSTTSRQSSRRRVRRIVKVMLHISADEQKKRLLERLERPEKHWKFNPGDIDERELWPRYMEAYQVGVRPHRRRPTPRGT